MKGQALGGFGADPGQRGEGLDGAGDWFDVVHD